VRCLSIPRISSSELERRDDVELEVQIVDSELDGVLNPDDDDEEVEEEQVEPTELERDSAAAILTTALLASESLE
jgi:hypothetical protein